jgi:leader peptidase (prepilin peptidase) / N-methyltransferase
MITALFVFVLGACAGSFCSALLYRTRHGGSVVSGRSRCTSCNKELGPLDLIPILSWLIRRGRCRFCKAPFSWQYLALEVVMGSLFVAAYYGSGCSGLICYPPSLWAEVGKKALFLVFLALIFVYDARHGEIPDSFSLIGALCAFILNVFINPVAWPALILAVIVGAGFFAVQYAISGGRWVGDGDILVGAMMGAMLGWPDTLTAIFVAYFIGMFAVAILMLVRKKSLNDAIPLGPFLALGTAAVIFLPPNFLLRFWYAFSF